MNPIRAHARKFLKDNLTGGTQIADKAGWFTTREVFEAILPHLRPDTHIDQLSDTLCVLRKRGEIESQKGANGNSHYGYHRFVRDSKIVICTGTVGLANRHRDRAHQRELYRLRELKKGRVVGVDRKSKPRKAEPNKPSVPKRTPLGYKTADIPPPPVKERRETYEEFLARGGKPEVLPPFQSVPRYIMCSPKDTRSESQRRGG